MAQPNQHPKRKTFTIALIGMDGVGKTTIARRLEKSFPMPIKYLYMGDNVDSSNVILPTTRWIRARRKAYAHAGGTQGNGRMPSRRAGRLKSILKAPARAVIKGLGLANQALEELYRQAVANSYLRRGYFVIFDRHFAYDYYHTDVETAADGLPLRRRLHGFLLRHLLPNPELVIYLDAPAEVVFKRKGEFSVAHLEKRREQYASLREVVAHFAVTNANRPVEEVERDVTLHILNHYRSKQNGAGLKPATAAQKARRSDDRRQTANRRG